MCLCRQLWGVGVICLFVQVFWLIACLCRQLRGSYMLVCSGGLVDCMFVSVVAGVQ